MVFFKKDKFEKVRAWYIFITLKSNIFGCAGVQHLSALTNRESADKLNETQKGKEK